MRRQRRKILFFGFENFRIKKELTLIFMLNKFSSHDISILPSSEVEIMAGLCISQEQDVVKQPTKQFYFLTPVQTMIDF